MEGRLMWKPLPHLAMHGPADGHLIYWTPLMRAVVRGRRAQEAGYMQEWL